MGPGDDDFVSRGESCDCCEYFSGVADSNFESNHRTRLGYGCGKVNGPENDHPRFGLVRRNKYLCSRFHPFSIVPVHEQRRFPSCKEPSGIVDHRVIKMGATQRPGSTFWPDNQTFADPFRLGMLNHSGCCHRVADLNISYDGREFGEGLSGETFYEHVDDATAGQTNCEGVIIAITEAL